MTGPVAIGIREPIAFGGAHLRNRLVLAAVTRGMADEDGTPTAEMAAYYRRFAQGDVGLIVTEATFVPGPAGRTYLRQPGLASQRHAGGWKRIVDAVKGAGGHIFVQLQHGGPFREPELGPAVGPTSRVPAVPSWQRQRVYHETRRIAIGDLPELAEGFGQAAAFACAAGFDGVEIHGSRGYLLDAFLSGTNDRDDVYGGELDNRLRFPCEVVRAVRCKIGTLGLTYNLSLYKMDSVDYQPPGGIAEQRRIVEALSAAGVDAFHVSTRRLGRCHIAGTPLVDVVRSATDRVVIGGGGIQTIADAESALRCHRLDMVSSARALVANPDILQRTTPQPYKRGMERVPALEHPQRPAAVI